MLSTAEGQPRFNCPCYCSSLLGSRLSLQAPWGMAIPMAHSLLHRAPEPVASTKAEWSMTNECEARSSLPSPWLCNVPQRDVVHPSYCTLWVCIYLLSLCHLVMIFCKQQHHLFLLGVCMNYMALTAPHSGNTFSLVRSVGQTLMSTFSSFLLSRALASHVSICLSQDEVKFNHKTLSSWTIKGSYFMSSFFLAVFP